MLDVDQPKPSAELVLAIIRETKLQPDFYTLPGLSSLLDNEGFESKLYVCISPKITFTRKGYPKQYAELNIDLRDYNGSPSCDHKMIRKYWEVSDRGNSWVCCFKCGFHTSNKPLGFFKRLLTSKFPD